MKIGLVGPFEGRYREIGQEIIYAARLAVREANEAGGVAGYSIELVAFDDGGDAAQAEEQARKLATDPQVVGVVGNWLEPTTLAAAPVLAANNIPFLATTSSSDLDLSAFRLWPTDFALQAAVPEATFCSGHCDSLEDLDWLKSQIPAQPANDTRNPKSQIAGPPLWGLNQFPRLAGSAEEGVRVVAPAPLPADSADPAFADRYRAISQGVEPRFLAVLAYDATRLLLTAIQNDVESKETPTRDGVALALAQLTYNGLSGGFSFNAEQDWAEANGWVYRWQGGQLVRP
ncbi:MAG: ABC transporter substrate-binding protein [Chloroflexi bacterium]|nr:ABC transporter substrate-binding protein [Chloroflexota bacterium]